MTLLRGQAYIFFLGVCGAACGHFCNNAPPGDSTLAPSYCGFDDLLWRLCISRRLATHDLFLKSHGWCRGVVLMDKGCAFRDCGICGTPSGALSMRICGREGLFLSAPSHMPAPDVSVSWVRISARRSVLSRQLHYSRSGRSSSCNRPSPKRAGCLIFHRETSHHPATKIT